MKDKYVLVTIRHVYDNLYIKKIYIYILLVNVLICYFIIKVYYITKQGVWIYILNIY